jgi:curved DNA-binding protein CbpA
MLRDYYALLGLPRSAALPEIKSAYRKLAAEHHPDKMAVPDSTKILELNEAMSVLGDVQRKAKYDHDLSFIPERPAPAGASSVIESPTAEPSPQPKRESAPPQNAGPALRAASLLVRLRALPVHFAELKWPGWTWSLKTEGRNAIAVAYRHVEAMNPQVLRAIAASIHADGATPIVVLTCKRIEDRPRLLRQLEELTAGPKSLMLILYDELGNRGIRFGKPPEHEHAAAILKVLMAA